MRSLVWFWLSIAGCWGLGAQEVLELDQAKAIKLALEKNFSVRVAEITPEIAEQRIHEEKAVFDPQLNFEYSSDRNQTTTEATTNNYNAGISGRTSLGTTYNIGVAIVKQESWTNNTDPPSTGFLGISLRQPLLEGFGFSNNLTELRITETRHELTEWQFRQVIMDVITNVIIAYNDYYFSARNLDVSKRNRDLAKKLLKDNRIRVQAGGMATLDIGQNESQLALREELVLVAENALKFRENQLKFLISNDDRTILGRDIFIDTLPRIGAVTINPMHDFEEALARRPDYQQALLELHIAGLLMKQSRNQALPELDLIVDYGISGDGFSFDNSLRSLSRNGSENYHVGFAFNQSIPNRADRARRLISKLNANLSKISLQNLEQSIYFDLDTFAQRVGVDWKRVGISRHARELAEVTLAAEERKLQAGTSTTFVILRLQSDLASAEIRELIALTDYNKSLARYDLLLGRAGHSFGVTEIHDSLEQ